MAEVRSEYQIADLIILTFETQLAALRSALLKIKEWAKTETSDPHHLLTIDLDRSISCCRLLVDKIQMLLSGLQPNQASRSSRRGKVKFVFEAKEMKGLRKMVESQTSALTLLFTACNIEVESTFRRDRLSTVSKPGPQTHSFQLEQYHRNKRHCSRSPRRGGSFES